MSIYFYSRSCAIASAMLLTGSLALAQATTAGTTPKKTTTTAPASANSTTITPRQDQYPKASGAITAAPTPDASTDAKKHVANIKWSAARQAGDQQTLDAGSKDAAKSTIPALDGASKDAAKTTIPATDGASKDAAKSSVAVDKPGTPGQPTPAANGMAITEQGVPAKPKPTTNKMAIKENGIYTTPAKPKP